jgi:hypothetical protein
MNQGKRCIHYTVLALLGATLLGTAAERLYQATVDNSKPGWLRSVASLGLVVHRNTVPEPAHQMTATATEQLASLRGFTRLQVEGDLGVEIISAAEYKVSLAPASDRPWSIATSPGRNGLLAITGGPGTEGSTLRVEAPALTSIEATNLRQLAIRGWHTPDLTLRTKNLTDARIEESSVERWTLNAATPVVLQLDTATISAGLDMKYSGQIRVRGANDKAIASLDGTGGRITIKTGGVAATTNQ